MGWGEWPQEPKGGRGEKHWRRWEERGQNKLDAHIDRNSEEDNGRKEEDNVEEGVQKTRKRPRIGKQQRRRGRAPREGGSRN